jgi:hypothetical protein
MASRLRLDSYADFLVALEDAMTLNLAIELWPDSEYNKEQDWDCAEKRPFNYFYTKYQQSSCNAALFLDNVKGVDHAWTSLGAWYTKQLQQQRQTEIAAHADAHAQARFVEVVTREGLEVAAVAAIVHEYAAPLPWSVSAATGHPACLRRAVPPRKPLVMHDSVENEVFTRMSFDYGLTQLTSIGQLADNNDPAVLSFFKLGRNAARWWRTLSPELKARFRAAIHIGQSVIGCVRVRDVRVMKMATYD